jgi:hypothetical protein
MGRIIFYSTLLTMLAVALAGLAIATATLPSVPAAAMPARSHILPGPDGAGPGDQRGSSRG